ncbi:MAG: MFS transporter, partial [Nanoarchaeota archaeon]
SLQAIVYDSLKDRKLEKLNSKVLGIIDVFSSVGAFVAAFIGAFFYSFNNTLPYWITMLTGGAGFISLLFFKEPKYKKAGEKIYFFKNFKTGLSLLWKNPVLYSLLILYIPLFFFDEAWYTAKQPFLIQLGLPLVLLGAYEAFKNLFFIIGGLTLPKLLNKFGHKTLLAGVVIAQALTWWILGTNNLYAVVIFSYSLILWRQFWTYIDADIIHKHIHSSVRATTLSARQMIISAIFIFNPWMMGYLVNSISRNILFPIFGLIVLIIAGSVFLARRKYF